MKQLRLVETFAELRRGMVVIDLMCPCGKVHEVVLLELRAGVSDDANDLDVRSAWRLDVICVPLSWWEWPAIDAEMVAEYRIFEVLQAQSVVAREREKVRSR